MTELEKVYEFNYVVRGVERPKQIKFLQGAQRNDRAAYMQEELNEFIEADSIEGQVDAIIDLLYFSYGTLYEMGISKETFEQCFDIVHNANMCKVAGKKDRATAIDGVDAKKPEGWEAPTLEGIIRDQDC